MIVIIEQDGRSEDLGPSCSSGAGSQGEGPGNALGADHSFWVGLGTHLAITWRVGVWLPKNTDSQLLQVQPWSLSLVESGQQLER